MDVLKIYINALTTVLKCRFIVMCSFFNFSIIQSCHDIVKRKWFCFSFGINFWRILLIKFYHIHKVEEFIVIINISLLPLSNKEEIPISKVSQKKAAENINQHSCNGMRSGLMSCYLYHEQLVVELVAKRDWKRQQG